MVTTGYSAASIACNPSGYVVFRNNILVGNHVNLPCGGFLVAVGGH